VETKIVERWGLSMSIVSGTNEKQWFEAPWETTKRPWSWWRHYNDGLKRVEGTVFWWFCDYLWSRTSWIINILYWLSLQIILILSWFCIDSYYRRSSSSSRCPYGCILISLASRHHRLESSRSPVSTEVSVRSRRIHRHLRSPGTSSTRNFIVPVFVSLHQH
jgi:hypothetical protein